MKKPEPLVSVICLCYNHKQYVKASIDSVINQTYQNIQIILVDDASTDGSQLMIEEIIKQYPEIQPIVLPKNIDNCAAFNKGLALAKGKYIVDLAADDRFEPTRIEKQVALFDQLPNDYGVIHTNAIFVDENDNFLSDHTQRLQNKGLIKTMPQGDVYSQVLSKYFVSAATMLVKKQVFDELDGYDESLSYEDFDFWVRSARKWKYAYLDEQLTVIRRLPYSKSFHVNKEEDPQLFSTYLVCKKARQLNQSEEEDKSLVVRLKYELKHAVLSSKRKEAELFYELLSEYKRIGFIDKLLILILRLKLPMSWVRGILF